MILALSILSGLLATTAAGLVALWCRSREMAALVRATAAERALERATIECSQERARATAERERATEATARRDVVVAELQEIAKHAAPEVRLARLDAALKRFAR